MLRRPAQHLSSTPGFNETEALAMSTFPWKAAVLILIFAVAMLALGAAKWIRPADYAAVVDFPRRPETLPAIPEVRSASPVKAGGRTPANPNKIPLAPEST